MSKRKPYVRPMGATWWIHNAAHRFYILREMTSLFVALYSLLLLAALVALCRGEAAWTAYLGCLQSTGMMLTHFFCLVMVLLHSFTWFSLTPKTMDLRIQGKAVPAEKIVLAHYLGFAGVSLVLLILLGGWL